MVVETSKGSEIVLPSCHYQMTGKKYLYLGDHRNSRSLLSNRCLGMVCRTGVHSLAEYY